MSELPSLLDRMVKAAPSLAEWRDDARDSAYRDDLWLHLAYELIDQGASEVARTLAAIALFIEEAIERYDDKHQVSIELIETLIGLAEERHYDTAALRQHLGPLATEIWDSLTDYLHQQDWTLIHLDSKRVAAFPQTPAVIHRWLAKSGTRLPAGSALALLKIGDKALELVALLPCRVDRFAPKDGDILLPGTLLCYLLPDDYRQLRREEPYLGLRATAPSAA
jgi:hypothetical protein